MTKKLFQKVVKKFLLEMTKLLLPILIGHHGGKTLLKFFFFLCLDQDGKTLYAVSLCHNLALKSVGVLSLLQPISSNYPSSHAFSVWLQ